jgi:hypothetical protein
LQIVAKDIDDCSQFVDKALRKLPGRVKHPYWLKPLKPGVKHTLVVGGAAASVDIGGVMLPNPLSKPPATG